MNIKNEIKELIDAQTICHFVHFFLFYEEAIRRHEKLCIGQNTAFRFFLTFYCILKNPAFSLQSEKNAEFQNTASAKQTPRNFEFYSK
jgi:hypothetical protein